jgi:hypothetical protein
MLLLLLQAHLLWWEEHALLVVTIAACLAHVCHGKRRSCSCQAIVTVTACANHFWHLLCTYQNIHKCPANIPTAACLPQAFHGEKELFLSDHFDRCSVKTVMAKCRVLSLSRYQELATVEEHDFFARFTYRVSKGAAAAAADTAAVLQAVVLAPAPCTNQNHYMQDVAISLQQEPTYCEAAHNESALFLLLPAVIPLLSLQPIQRSFVALTAKSTMFHFCCPAVTCCDSSLPCSPRSASLSRPRCRCSACVRCPTTPTSSWCSAISAQSGEQQT